MSGFIKGIVVGLGSFGLGFVVLSVVLPVDAPGRLQPSPAQVEAERQAEVDLVPATVEPVGADLAPEAEPVIEQTTAVPDPAEPSLDAVPVSPVDAANLPIEAEVQAQEPAEPLVEAQESVPTAAADPAAAAPLPEATDAAPAEVVEPVAAPDSAEPLADGAPEEMSVTEMPVAEIPSAEITVPEAAVPDAQPAPVASAEPEPQAAPAAGEMEAPADAPVAAEIATEAPDAGPAPDVDLTPAPDAGPLTAGAADTPGGVRVAAADASSLAQAGTALDQARASLAPIEQATGEAALPQTTAPTVPEPEPPAPVAVEPAPQPAPSVEQEASLAPVPAARVPLSEPLLPRAPGFATERPPVQTMPTGAPQIAVRRGATADAAPRQVEGVTVGRLARIGVPASEPATAEPTPAPADSGLPAAQRFAALPAITGDERPLGVVLTDSAASQTAILALGVPVTVALDPYDADAPRRAADYRRAGHEIALLAARMPALATPADLTVILDAWMRDFPETVALMDVPLNGVGANPTLARDLTAMLAVDGYAAIALRGGLDAFLQAAEDSDLPAVAVYREIDSTGQSEIAVRRMIDRAAFEALRRPGILIAGSADDSGLMTELADFAQGRGRDGVALAPASAVFSEAR
ncbi:divergent polysaccharide deacetylase family protein [Pararhodobacter zhoushanensis]|uniref:divergent polysaccharide deacetylase family protein n=1 Tax=Pararhodobacter zhoushanensis TaxID=2479545 RepID=UPI000F8EB9C9|nr:divergent polysaccharide deacetylase family protein [Pararhodobacter zhoushanensis]